MFVIPNIWMFLSIILQLLPTNVHKQKWTIYSDFSLFLYVFNLMDLSSRQSISPFDPSYASNTG